jgi:serine/threonine protein kinase
MATVYLARDLRYDRAVALKVLHAELSATLGAERFQREILIAARLQHPHILMLIEAGEAAGRLYYTMPFVEGESLRQRLLRDRVVAPAQAVGLVREVADALDYAHQRGVIHRDIKPENILLSAGHALVADFGVAKAVTTATDQALTRTGFPVGTVGYMSPEQAAGITDLNERTDVYSLAATTYEMLVGEIPGMWPGEEAARARRFVDIAPRHREALDRLPGALEPVLVRGLFLRDTQRHPTPGAFAADLADALGPSPRFSSTDAHQILARAAELDATTPTTDQGMSLGGLQRIGGEVGIAPERIAEAAKQVARRDSRPVPVNPFLGSPTRLVVERTARREYSEADLPALIESLRTNFGDIGQVSRLGRELSWQTVAYPGARVRQVYVTLRPETGVTRIRIEEQLRAMAGAYFGGLMGGLGGGGMGGAIGIGMGVFHSAVAAGALVVSLIGGSYTLARSLFRHHGQKRSAELDMLADRLVSYIEDPGRR